MVNLINELRNALTAIANAIRIRTGNSSTLSLDEMPNAIRTMGFERAATVTDWTKDGNNLVFNNILYNPQYIVIAYNRTKGDTIISSTSNDRRALCIYGSYTSGKVYLNTIWIQYYRNSSNEDKVYYHNATGGFSVEYNEENHTLTVSPKTNTSPAYSLIDINQTGYIPYSLTYFY